MKLKVGTILDETILQKLKEQSVQEGRSMSEIIGEALSSYFGGSNMNTKLRLAAVERLCSRPFRLSKKQIQSLLERDPYEP